MATFISSLFRLSFHPVFRIRIRIRIQIHRIQIVFGSHGSGSISQRFGSGFGSGSKSFYHLAKIVRKTLISTVLWLRFDFLSLKNDVKVPTKSTMQKNVHKKIRFLLASWRSMMKIEGSGSISQRLGSADPDPEPHQNVMDQEHCFHQMKGRGIVQVARGWGGGTPTTVNKRDFNKFSWSALWLQLVHFLTTLNNCFRTCWCRSMHFVAWVRGANKR